MSSQEQSQNSPGREFKQELGLLDSTMIVAGCMIGSGIFIVSADIARTVGCAGYLLLVWLITGIITIIAALSYGELAGMMPYAGGQYVYLREAFNPLIGFLYGWTFFLVIQCGSIAAVAVAFAKFAAVLVPLFSENRIVVTKFGLNISAAQVLAIDSIIALTYLNSRGLREGKIVQDIFTIAKVLALIGLILLGVIVGENASAISANFSNMWNASWTHFEGGKITSVDEALSGLMLLAAIGVAMVGSLFAADAWNSITFTAGEVKNPKRNIPLSLILGVGGVILLYILANCVYLIVLPLKGNAESSGVIERGIQFAVDERVGTAAAYMIFGAAASSIMAILIMVSTFGCNNGMILTGARVYYTMARDGLFFKSVSKLNNKGVPAVALAFQGVWASLLCLSGKYGDLLDYVIFAVLLFYILTIIGIFILRVKKPNAERPYKTWGYPILPLAYILIASAICIDLLIFKPLYTWPGVGIVLIGIPVYFVWKKAPKNTTS